jgi:hypothetical protein
MPVPPLQADVARALHLRGDPHLQPGLCLQCGAVKPAAADAEACLGVIGALATAPACPPCGAGSALDTLRRCEAVLAGKSVLAEDTLVGGWHKPTALWRCGSAHAVG